MKFGKTVQNSFVIIFVLVLISHHSKAQQRGLELAPLGNNPIIIKHLKENPSFSKSNQVCGIDTLQLPFFDDFSSPQGIYPDCAKWRDNHVFINTAMAYLPPSIGVATFDGLRPDGKPYSQFASPSAGQAADTLTSQFINLAGLTAADAVYLSFFLQQQGLGDRPEIQDSFFIDFKDTANQWITVKRYGGVANSFSSLAIPDFKNEFIAIDSAKFLYNGFQFRFRNYASICGNNDHWHLDYVYLQKNRNNADTSQSNYGKYADVAYTKPPSSPLYNGYTAMPWRHFTGNHLFTDSLTLDNYNHNPCNTAGTLDRLCEVKEISPNTSSLLRMPIPALANYSCSPNQNDAQKYSISATWGNLVPTQKTVLESKSTILFPSNFQSGAAFAGNDTVYQTTVLDNYFAYDDGTAEHRAIAQGIGTTIAVEFMAEVADTIRGVYFHLPYFTNRNAEIDFINVKIWLDSLDNEVFSRDFYKLHYEEGFNGFHFVEFKDYTGRKIPVSVQAGQKFYIGWQQASSTAVPVGFDKSTDASSKTFISTGSSWTTSTIKGAIMIRPLLSPDSNFRLIATDKIALPEVGLKLYPNPTTDILYLELENNDFGNNYQIVVRNVLGQKILEQSFANQISLHSCQTGLYILTLEDNNGKIISKHKLIKQ